jgi:hypothetical protein
LIPDDSICVTQLTSAPLAKKGVSGTTGITGVMGEPVPDFLHAMIIKSIPKESKPYRILIFNDFNVGNI